MPDHEPAFRLPALDILSWQGDPQMAEVCVARTRAQDATSLIEFVDGLDARYSRREKWIINLSTQYGCPVGCVFCDAAHRYFGDLSADEMLAQVACVLARHPGLAETCAKLKVHFARMGEPALNDAVLEALTRLPALTQAPGLWACLATTAPLGRETWFARLLEIKERLYRGRFQLQISLNTSDEAHRRTLTPIRTESFAAVSAYCARFVREGDRKAVLNFAVAQGLALCAQTIADCFSPDHVAIKLTPLNPTREGKNHALRSLSEEEIAERAESFRVHGFETILSFGDGREDRIGSNCGQSVRREREAV